MHTLKPMIIFCYSFMLTYLEELNLIESFSLNHSEVAYSRYMEDAIVIALKKMKGL